MKMTRARLQQIIKEEIKRLNEGDVIQGPWGEVPPVDSEPADPEPADPELINFVKGLGEVLGQKLEDQLGVQTMDIPIDKLGQLDVVMAEIEKLLGIED